MITSFCGNCLCLRLEACDKVIQTSGLCSGNLCWPKFLLFKIKRIQHFFIIDSGFRVYKQVYIEVSYYKASYFRLLKNVNKSSNCGTKSFSLWLWGLYTTQKYSIWLLRKSTSIFKTCYFCFKDQGIVRNRFLNKKAPPPRFWAEVRCFDSRGWYPGRVSALIKSFSVSHLSIETMTLGFFEKFCSSWSEPSWWHLNYWTVRPSEKLLCLLIKAAVNWFSIQNKNFSQNERERLRLFDKNAIVDTNNLITST